MSTYGSDKNANELLNSLLEGDDLDIPELDLNSPEFNLPGDATSEIYKQVRRITNQDLTTGIIDGPGTFDSLMTGFKAHLREEYQNSRISGAEYTKAFIALTEGAMSNAVQFLLGQDAAYWQAVTAQVGAITARVGLAVAKLQYYNTLMEARNHRANYALTKLKLATEDMTYATGKFNLENILPQQKLLLLEQTEAQRAQTLDNRTDGDQVTGLLGKQKDLYSQQITSYKRDAELKAAKVFADAWTVMKTIDEGLVPPNSFSNSNLDTILNTVKANNELGN